jgi:large subunit ribosomal protein L49
MNHFLRVARLSTTAASKTAFKVPPPSALQATIERKVYPYRITRTPSNNYPIYTLAKRGGNMKLTKLRRIEGDVNVLRKDLQLALGMDEKDVVINQLTRHIIVKVFRDKL